MPEIKWFEFISLINIWCLCVPGIFLDLQVDLRKAESLLPWELQPSISPCAKSDEGNEGS